MANTIDLLRAIQDGSTSAKVPVSELLRHCQVFAARVNLPELGGWVRHELNGYPPKVELPDYRVLSGTAHGNFLGPFGSGLRNAPLPAGNLPKEYRDWAQKAYIRQPIAAMEEAAASKKGSITVVWPADLIVRVQNRFYEGMSLAQAWLDLSRTDFTAAVESVRNRILTFSLEAEQYIEASGDDSRAVANPSELSHVFHTYIYGSVGNFAAGSVGVEQTSVSSSADLSSLVQELREIGIPEPELNALKDAVASDGGDRNGKLGARVGSWMGNAITKIASGSWKVATDSATVIIPRLIARYYNLPG